MTTHQDARDALAAKDAAERNLANLALCPPWRHAAFAGLIAALIATPAAALPLRFAIFALIFLAIALIVRSDRRRLGVFINGYRRGRTRLVVAPLLALVLLLYMGSFHYGVIRGEPGISLALGAVGFVVGYIGSVLWQRVFVRELGA